PIHPTTVAGMRSAKKSNAALGHEDAGDVATAGVSDVKRLQPADIATTVHVERGETTAAAGPPTDRDRPDDGCTVRKGAHRETRKIDTGTAVEPVVVAIVYERWIASWETALTALTSASQTGALRTNEAAPHRASILAEREVVTKLLRLVASLHARTVVAAGRT